MTLYPSDRRPGQRLNAAGPDPRRPGPTMTTLAPTKETRYSL